MKIAQNVTYVANYALATALQGFIPERKAEEIKTSSVAKITIAPMTESSAPIAAIPILDVDIVDVDKLMPPQPVSRVKIAPSVSAPRNVVPARARLAQRGNVSVRIIFHPQKLMMRVETLLQRKEDPVLVMNIRERNVETSLTLQLSLTLDGVKLKVCDGSGRLFSLFPKNSVFYSSELADISTISSERTKMVNLFIREIHYLQYNLFIAERKKATPSISTEK